MAAIQDLLVGRFENRATAEATAAAATADQAAPGAEKQLIVTGVVISTSGAAPAAGGNYESRIVEDPLGTPVIRWTTKLPASAFAPLIYEFKRPIHITANKGCRLDISNLGAGAIGRVELHTITRPVTTN